MLLGTYCLKIVLLYAKNVKLLKVIHVYCRTVYVYILYIYRCKYVYTFFKIGLGEHLRFPPFSKKLKKQISLMSAYFFYLMYYYWLLAHIFLSIINLCGEELTI